MRKRKDIQIMYYKCCSCNGMTTVPRQKGRLRGVGHLKDMWCPFCGEEKKFVEIGMYQEVVA